MRAPRRAIFAGLKIGGMKSCDRRSNAIQEQLNELIRNKERNMRDLTEYSSRAPSSAPTAMFNLLRAAYGSRAAEGIFRAYGIATTASAVRCVQK